MKKTLALLLAAVLSISLAACGGSESTDRGHQSVETNSKPQTVESSTPKEDSSTESSAKESETESSEEESVFEEESQVEESQTPEYIQKWIDRMAGTWFAGDETGLVCETFSVSEDAKITINGETYSVKITTQESWEWASLDLYAEDGTMTYEMRIDLEDDDRLEMSFIYQDNNGPYYREDQYDVIEITAENWLDYFEFGEYISTGTNAFGEYDGMGVYRHVCVKEAYKNVVPELSNGAVEYSYQWVEKEIIIHPEEQSYTLGADTGSSDEDTQISSFSAIAVAREGDAVVHSFGFEYGGFFLAVENDSTVDYPVFGEMLRIVGTLYLYNGNGT